MKSKFKQVGIYLTDENVRSAFKYEYKPKKVENQLTNIIVHDLKPYHKNRALTYCISLYRLSKLAGKYNGGLSFYKNEKCKKDTIVVDEVNCITK